MSDAAKPLTATLAEHLGLPAKLVAEPIRRPAPHVGPPPPAPPKPQLHALPPPSEPDRSHVEVSKAKPEKAKPEKKKRRWHKIPDAEALALVCRFRALLVEGKQKKEAYRELGVAGSLMHKLCAKGYKMPDQLREKILARSKELEAEGYTLSGAASLLGVHQTTLSLWRRQAGQPSQRVPKPQKPQKPQKPAANGAALHAPAPAKAKGPRTVESVVLEMGEAQARVAALKAELRALVLAED